MDKVLHVQTYLEVSGVVGLGMIDTFQVQTEVTRKVVLSEDANAKLGHVFTKIA